MAGRRILHEVRAALPLHLEGKRYQEGMKGCETVLYPRNHEQASGLFIGEPGGFAPAYL